MTSCYWRIPRVLNACFHLTLLLSFSINTTIRLDIMLLTYSASVERVFPSHSTVELLHQHDHTSWHRATDVFRECWTRVSISLYCWASPLTRSNVLTSCYWRIPRVLNACFHLTLLLSFSINTTIRLDIMLLTYSASVERVFPSHSTVELLHQHDHTSWHRATEVFRECWTRVSITWFSYAMHHVTVKTTEVTGCRRVLTHWDAINSWKRTAKPKYLTIFRGQTYPVSAPLCSKTRLVADEHNTSAKIFTVTQTKKQR